MTWSSFPPLFGKETGASHELAVHSSAWADPVAKYTSGSMPLPCAERDTSPISPKTFQKNKLCKNIISIYWAWIVFIVVCCVMFVLFFLLCVWNSCDLKSWKHRVGNGQGAGGFRQEWQRDQRQEIAASWGTGRWLEGNCHIKRNG